MINTISLNSVVVAAQEQISTDLDGECVVLELKSGEYFGLNELGSRIWSLVSEPMSVNEVRDSILNEYEVDDLKQCELDVCNFIAELVSDGLIEVVNERDS